MIISTPISLGELLDKISILIIKKKNIKNDKKLLLIDNELNLLHSNLSKTIKDKKRNTCKRKAKKRTLKKKKQKQ